MAFSRSIFGFAGCEQSDSGAEFERTGNPHWLRESWVDRIGRGGELLHPAGGRDCGGAGVALCAFWKARGGGGDSVRRETSRDCGCSSGALGTGEDGGEDDVSRSDRTLCTRRSIFWLASAGAAFVRGTSSDADSVARKQVDGFRLPFFLAWFGGRRCIVGIV